MHEHGLITRLLGLAREEARKRGGRVAAVKVRLGALSASTPEHFREDFEHVCDEDCAGAVRLDLELCPDHPAGVELVSVDVSVP